MAVSRSRRRSDARRKGYPDTGRLPRPTAIGLGAACFAVILLIWQLGYSHTLFVPSPASVASTFGELASSGETWGVLAISAQRLVLGLCIGIGLGLIAAIVGSESENLRRMVQVYVQVSFTLPSLLVGLMALVIFGLSEVGVILAVAVIVFPFVTAPVLDGLKTVDDAIASMATVYRVPRWQRFRDVTLPYIMPFLLGGIRNGHALAWRVLIVVEIFSVRSGLGFKFQRAFDLFQFSQVIVYLILMLAVIFAIEFFILKPLEARSQRWRVTSRKSTKRRIGAQAPTESRVGSNA